MVALSMSAGQAWGRSYDPRKLCACISRYAAMIALAIANAFGIRSAQTALSASTDLQGPNAAHRSAGRGSAGPHDPGGKGRATRHDAGNTRTRSRPTLARFRQREASQNFPNGLGQIARPSDKRGVNAANAGAAGAAAGGVNRDARDTAEYVNAAQRWAVEGRGSAFRS